ncbi:hypothetical protein PQX77_008775 [Marasmius sp. AFHP31]|nr:hypothetical protein PQX77_008775 [Marasmius sp. AFHP31]
MSDTSSEFSFVNSAPNGNSVHTHGPFPIWAFGAQNTYSNTPPSNTGMRFSGGENGGPQFGNSMFTVTAPNLPTSIGGTWLANLKLCILTHKHSDGSPCFNVLEHAAMADSEENESFIAAHTKLIQHILAPEKQRGQRLERENQRLVERNQFLCDDLDRLNALYNQRERHSSSISGHKRKSDSPDVLNRRPPPPKGSSRSEGSVPDISPSYTNLSSGAYILGRGVFLQLYQHANFRPGFTLSDSPLQWTDMGVLDVPDAIDRILRLKILPEILEFEGTPSGNQKLPRDPTELATLVERAHTPGNFPYLFHLRDSMGLGQVMQEVPRALHTSSYPLPAIIAPLLRENPNPDWVGHTRYLKLEDATIVSDSAGHWDSSPCRIPSIRTPNAKTSDEDCALFIFVHYDLRGHAGVILTDSGYVQLDSVMAYRTFSSMTPTDRSLTSFYRTSFVRLVTRPGLYAEILESRNIRINPSGRITKCPTKLCKDGIEGIARHFANCRISVALVKNMFHWGMQYCIDVQNIMSIPLDQRRTYAGIYNLARVRSQFYPIVSVRSDRTYKVPSHATEFEVLEYRRRQFILNHWKDSNSLPSADYKVPVVHVKPPTDSIPDSIGGLSLSEPGNAGTPPTGSSPSTVSATTATHVEVSASGDGQSQSAQATDVPLPAIPVTSPTPASSNPDVDMVETAGDLTSTQDAMEEVD